MCGKREDCQRIELLGDLSLPTEEKIAERPRERARTRTGVTHHERECLVLCILETDLILAHVQDRERHGASLSVCTNATYIQTSPTMVHAQERKLPSGSSRSIQSHKFRALERIGVTEKIASPTQESSSCWIGVTSERKNDSPARHPPAISLHQHRC